MTFHLWVENRCCVFKSRRDKPQPKRLKAVVISRETSAGATRLPTPWTWMMARRNRFKADDVRGPQVLGDATVCPGRFPRQYIKCARERTITYMWWRRHGREIRAGDNGIKHSRSSSRSSSSSSCCTVPGAETTIFSRGLEIPLCCVHGVSTG